MLIDRITVYRFSIPMVPFTIATGTMNFAQNILIHVHTDTGLLGVGECSAFPMIAGETQDTCYVLAKDFATIWLGKNSADMLARMAELNAYIANNHTIKSAFDMALYDLAAKSIDLPLYKYLGGTYFEPESDLTIGIGSVQEMADAADDFVRNRSVHIIKVKLGKKVTDDIQRITAIRQVAGPSVQLRIDANQGWNFEEAAEALTAMGQFDIRFCEQPMPKTLDDRLPELRALSPIPIMADESVFDHRDAERLLKAGACDYVNIKLSKAGGIAEALLIHDVCAKYGVPNMLGGMLESRVALSAKVHMALACPNIHFYDLDTALLGHQIDPVVNGVQFNGMRLHLPDLPGIGADGDPAFLQACEHFTIS